MPSGTQANTIFPASGWRYGRRPLIAVPIEGPTRMVMRIAGCAFLVLLVPSPVLAQPPSDVPQVLIVLGDRSVQLEIELTASQGKKLGELWRKQTASNSRLANLPSEQRSPKKKELNEAFDRALFDILSADQRQRLKEIHLQLLGPKAYSDPEVIREVAISMDQQLQIAALEDWARGEMTKWQQQQTTAGMTPSRDASRSKMIELEKSAHEKAQQVLSQDQKARWKDLIGRPYGALITTSAALTKIVGQ